MQECVSPNTNIALYADDTKIWRTIKCEEDCWKLQQDINSLINWALVNCMRFHPKKCKILTISHKRINSLINLPFVKFQYYMNEDILDYTEIEKDLGIIVQHKFSWNVHCTSLLSQAINKFNLLRRTCHL